MKKAGIIVGIVIIVLAVLGLTKNMIVKTSVEKGVRLATGLDLEIGSMDVGFLKTYVGIKGLKLHNPDGYPDPIMVDFSDIYVDYDLGAILKKDIHLEQIRIHLKELTIVKNKNGDVNLNELKSIAEGGEKTSASKNKASSETKAASEIPPVRIDELLLRVDRVVYKDYSRGAVKVRNIDINLDERYENITDVKKLVNLIVLKTLMSAGLMNIAGLAVDEITGQVSDLLAGASDFTDKALGDVTEILKDVDTAKMEEAVTEAAKKLEDMTKSLGEKFNLFGGK
ncbi:AsmA family protein [PVC group bacterium]|nr:AsmA family protein [PVC group bacterium]